MNMKAGIKNVLSSMGYEIRRVSNDPARDAFRKLHRISVDPDRDPFQDMRKLAASERRLVIIDAGANVGQSISRFRSDFDHPIIHAFEPDRDAFGELQRRTSGVPDVALNNVALGSQPGAMDLIRNTASEMTSLLEPGTNCWGAVKETCQIPVITLDDYCAKRGIAKIDILKSDTQGFDLEVIKGAKQLLVSRQIHLIYIEIIFSDMYKGLPRFDQVYGFLADHGFSLVSFYKFFYQDDRVAWTDALFVNPQFGT